MPVAGEKLSIQIPIYTTGGEVARALYAACHACYIGVTDNSVSLALLNSPKVELIGCDVAGVLGADCKSCFSDRKMSPVIIFSPGINQQRFEK